MSCSTCEPAVEDRSEVGEIQGRSGSLREPGVGGGQEPATYRISGREEDAGPEGAGKPFLRQEQTKNEDQLWQEGWLACEPAGSPILP